MDAWHQYNRVPVIDSTDERGFQYLFSKRIPILINLQKLVGIWSPAYWRSRHGHMEVTVDIVPQMGSVHAQEMTLEQFLDRFESPGGECAAKLSVSPCKMP